jgi:hypothetical protein
LEHGWRSRADFIRAINFAITDPNCRGTIPVEFRAKRQQRTVVATVTGGAVGLVTAGPLGAVVCATGAYAAAKTVGKHREHRLLEKCLQSNISSDMYDNATTSSSSQRTMVVANTASSSLASGIPIHRAEAA